MVCMLNRQLEVVAGTVLCGFVVESHRRSLGGLVNSSMYDTAAQTMP